MWEFCLAAGIEFMGGRGDMSPQTFGQGET